MNTQKTPKQKLEDLGIDPIIELGKALQDPDVTPTEKANIAKKLADMITPKNVEQDLVINIIRLDFGKFQRDPEESVREAVAGFTGYNGEDARLQPIETAPEEDGIYIEPEETVKNRKQKGRYIPPEDFN